MKRLQTKCFLGSALVHGLLAVALLVGPGFVGSKPVPNNLAILDVIPNKLVDELLSGGGAPGAPPPAPVRTPEPVTPPSPPTPPAPKPEPVVEKARPKNPEPPEETPKPLPPDETGLEPVKAVKPRPKKATELTKAELLTKKVTRASDESESETKAKRAADKARKTAAAAAAAWSKELKTALNTIQGGISSGVSIGPIGVGGTGGEAYANYMQAIQSIYDHAWIDPDEVTDQALNVLATVVIGRNGQVINYQITRRSGNTALDKSVERALRSVTQVPPFPEGAKENQRSYRIQFDLIAKRKIG
jgi:TonB family protein